MADQLMLNEPTHPHCEVCGACLISPALPHKCPAPVDLEILAVHFIETHKRIAKASQSSKSEGA